MSTWTIPSYSEGWTVPGFTERQELGRNASGRVVAAVHDASGHRVAIKYLNPDLLTRPAVPQRFRAEARRLVEYGDPRMGVRAYDYVEQPGEGAAIIAEPDDWAPLHELIEAALLPLLTRGGDARPPAGGGGRFTVIASGTVAAVLLISGVAAAVTLQSKNHGHPALAGATSPATASSAGPSAGTAPNAAPSAGTPSGAAAARTPTATASCAATCATPTANAGQPTASLAAGRTTAPARGGPAGASDPATNSVNPTSSAAPPVTSTAPGTTPLPQPTMEFVIPLTSTIDTLGTAYQGGTLVSGGKAPYTWKVTGLPPGLSVSTALNGASFEAVGTPTQAGTWTVTATVSDSENPAQTLRLTYPFTVSPKPWTIFTALLPDGTVGTPYTATVEGTTNVTIRWSATGLPAGLSIDPATGTISGTPTAVTSTSIAVTGTVTQPGAGTETKTATYTVLIRSA